MGGTSSACPFFLSPRAARTAALGAREPLRHAHVGPPPSPARRLRRRPEPGPPQAQGAPPHLREADTLPLSKKVLVVVEPLGLAPSTYRLPYWLLPCLTYDECQYVAHYPARASIQLQGKRVCGCARELWAVRSCPPIAAHFLDVLASPPSCSVRKSRGICRLEAIRPAPSVYKRRVPRPQPGQLARALHEVVEHGSLALILAREVSERHA